MRVGGWKGRGGKKQRREEEKHSGRKIKMSVG